jgi:hypothetical protein
MSSTTIKPVEADQAASRNTPGTTPQHDRDAAEQARHEDSAEAASADALRQAIGHEPLDEIILADYLDHYANARSRDDSGLTKQIEGNVKADHGDERNRHQPEMPLRERRALVEDVAEAEPDRFQNCPLSRCVTLKD